jgi:2-dehydropantoate 2-reductase
MTAIWTKVAINATANSITSVCRLRCGVLSTTPEAITLADQIIDEVAAVAKADGAPLNAEAIKENFHRLMAEMSDHLTSTEQDVLNKRPTEVGSINGGVVNKARALGISAPRNETMYLLIRTIEQNYAGQILN